MHNVRMVNSKGVYDTQESITASYKTRNGTKRNGTKRNETKWKRASKGWTLLQHGEIETSEARRTAGRQARHRVHFSWTQSNAEGVWTPSNIEGVWTPSNGNAEAEGPSC